MPVFITKVFYKGGIFFVSGVYSSLEKAKKAMEKIFNSDAAESCMVIEIELDNPKEGRRVAWEYDGEWKRL